ncbi:MAG: MotA/TolQ/ExbB proton channel family protein [Kiritimatiellae bacterium]|nr:MotA/TolQ/ExbB proton channel family protein [Kiritimatiellia bacterium]
MTLAGGPVFWMLVVLSIAALVVFFERFFELRRAQIDWQDFMKGTLNLLEGGNDSEALAICEDTQVPVANVVAVAIRNRSASARVLRDAVDSQGRAEIGRLDRRLASLAVIGQISPAVGLLGALIGFAKTVMLVNSGEIVSRIALLSDAMEAIVPAAIGLVLSITVAVMYTSLRTRLDRIVVELETAASQILGYIATAEAKK